MLLPVLPPRTGVEPPPDIPAAPPTISGTIPTALVEMSLADPGQEWVWGNETSFMRRFTIRTGRDDELDRAQAGQASVTQDNRTARYTPSNTQSPLYPHMIPYRSLRISALLDSGVEAFVVGDSYVGDTDYLGAGVLIFTLFTGYLEDFPLTWDVSDADAVTELQAVDGFTLLGQADYDEPWTLSSTDELAGSRVERVLDTIGWSSERDLDPGTVTILGNLIAVGGGNVAIPIHEKALEYLHKVAETEGGRVLMDGSGRFVFRDADEALDLDPTDIYGGQTGEIHYQDIEITPGAQRIWNQVTVSAGTDFITPATQSSSTSMAHFGQRSLSITLLPATHPDGSITDIRTRELKDRYAMPRQTITRLVLRPTTAATWIQVLQQEIGGYVVVRRRPAQGDEIEQVSRIEGIEINSPNTYDWSVTWTLSQHIDPPVSLLTENQRSLETDTTGWVAETNCTISQTTEVAREGLASLSVVRSAVPATVTTTPVGGIAVTVGRTYRGLAALRSYRPGLSIPSTRFDIDAHLEIAWYSAALGLLSTTVGTRSQGRGWKWYEVEGVAPALAAFAVLRISFDSDFNAAFTFAADLMDLYQVD